MDLMTIGICTLIGSIIGAIGHEQDMCRNLKRCGDAKAWTCAIHSREMMEGEE